MPTGIKVLIEVSPPTAPRCLLITPVNSRHARKFRKAVVANGGPDELSALVQGDSDVFDGLVSRQAYRDIRNGHDVVCLMDPFIVGTLYGYDANRVTF